MLSQRLLRPARTAFNAAKSTPSSSSRWICPTCLPQQQQSQHLPSSRRSKHTVPSFGAYDELYEKNGILGLFAPEGYRMGWLEYQAHLVEKLNALTAGEKWEHEPLQNIIVQYGRDAENASLFNHASMAFNNHFFYQTFSTAPQRLDNFPHMKADLERAFGSIDNLRESMIESAAGMFGPGFTWLVWNAGPGGKATQPGRKPTTNTGRSIDYTGDNERQGEWQILNTYSAGTPLGVKAHRRQEQDMNTSSSKPLGAMGAYSTAGQADANVLPGGTRLCPVLCVNTWQHVYLYDYGVRGKRNYLTKWWDAIDWLTVNLRCGENYGPVTLQHSGGSAHRGSSGGNNDQYRSSRTPFRYN